MSGTSADGIDAVLVRVSGNQVETVAFESLPFEPELRAKIRKAADPKAGTVDLICRLNFELGERFAEAAIRVMTAAGVQPAEVACIASHGQTIYHIPPGSERERAAGGVGTLQIGEPSIIAERTGVTTVADFRPRDMAVGGQGAPLVPFADYILFASPEC